LDDNNNNGDISIEYSFEPTDKRTAAIKYIVGSSAILISYNVLIMRGVTLL
jgi:hypothetical protein